MESLRLEVTQKENIAKLAVDTSSLQVCTLMGGLTFYRTDWILHKDRLRGKRQEETHLGIKTNNFDTPEVPKKISKVSQKIMLSHEIVPTV